MKGKMKKLKIAVMMSLVLAIAVFIVVLAADVTIDSFNEGTQDLTTTSSTSGTADHTSILGGERDSYLERISGTNSAHLEIDTGDDNRLAFTAGSNNKTKAEIVWDGNDNDAINIDYDGLGGSGGDGDLLDSTNDGVVITLLSWDGNSIDITITVYEDQGVNSSDYCSEGTLALRGIAITTSTTYSLSFDDDFAQCSGATNAVGDFGNAGAVVMEIMTTNTQGDLVLDMSITSHTRDFGDLPSDYLITTESNNGARHSKSATYFGAAIDEEADGVNSSGADGDNNAGTDDEDGVTRTTGEKWTNGTDGGHVTFSITTPMINDSSCVDGWIDWNDDDDFDDTGEHVINSEWTYYINSILNNLDKDFDIPDETFKGSGTIEFYSRWRIVPDTDGDQVCTDETDMTYDGYVTGGEVEDYLWSFNDPTAVTISSLEAHSPWLTSPYTLAAAVVLLVVMVGGLVVLQRRKA